VRLAAGPLPGLDSAAFLTRVSWLTHRA